MADFQGRAVIVTVPMRCNLLDRAARREFEWSLSNIDADVAWRREMVPVLVARAFAEAAGGAA